MKQLIASLLALLIAAPSIACYVPHPINYRAHEALVQEAKSILLVEVVPGSPCDFKVARVLKGTSEDAQKLRCKVSVPNEWTTDFNGHADGQFWQERLGRLGIEPSCEVQAPTFRIGHWYLLFLGLEPDVKLYEEVGRGDKWLQYVETQLSVGHGPNPSLQGTARSGRP